LEFMYHYLTARQLNDDIHDWEDDLKNGHLSPVVTQLIKTYFATSLTQSQLKINPTTIAQFRKLFWYEVLPQTINDIQQQLQLAKVAIEQNSIITKPQFFINLLQKLDITATKTLNEQQQAIEFIQTYQENDK
ncbi:hypothetical protein KJ628_01890, partial [Patescibacteria group bacterium]|nr:hypothetical protein [Patescibacteria group bacterium]